LPRVHTSAAVPQPPKPHSSRTPVRGTSERHVSHALLLVVLACLLLLSGAAARQVALGPLVSQGVAERANLTIGVAESAVRFSGGPGTELVGTWFQSTRETTLYSGAGDDATPLARVPAQAYLQVVGAVEGPYVEVRYPGGAAGVLTAWVSTTDVSPSAPPDDQQAAAPTSAPTVPPLEEKSLPGPVKVTTADLPTVSASYAVLVDGDSGEVLFGENAHSRVAPASLTKIVTAQLGLERSSLDDMVTVDVDSRTMYESTIMGLTPGETVSMRALLYGLMLPSGNDAALAIAKHVGGSEEGFVRLMNQRVAYLGLQDSQFMNPHGLDADGHYSTPYDMVMLARYGMRNGNFAALSSAKTWSGEGYTLNNLNKLLWAYPHADGIKVGYTDNSGRAIVASATIDGHRVYVGLMQAPDMVNDCITLFNYAFNNYQWGVADAA
jgi:D-alanyl-D-alanine carboxypeptidase